jgi:hypothetical protein
MLSPRFPSCRLHITIAPTLYKASPSLPPTPSTIHCEHFSTRAGCPLQYSSIDSQSPGSSSIFTMRLSTPSGSDAKKRPQPKYHRAYLIRLRHRPAPTSPLLLRQLPAPNPDIVHCAREMSEIMPMHHVLSTTVPNDASMRHAQAG